MATPKEIAEAERTLKEQLKRLRAARKGQPIDERDAQRELMRRKRAAARDIEIPEPANPQRRQQCEADILLSLQTYFPDTFTDPFTPQRIDIVNAIVRAARYGGDQAIAAPRGEGKTVIAESVLILLVCQGILRFPLIVAATGPDAARILGNIKMQFERNETLGEDYPEVCFPIQSLEGAPQRAGSQTVQGKRTYLKWAQDHVVLPTVDGSKASGAVIMTRGLDAAIRGIRVGKLRPDLVVIDDPETRESVASASQTEKRELTIEQDLAGLGGPGVKLSRIMLTTIMSRESLSAQYTDPTRKPSWAGKRMRFVEAWPENMVPAEEYITHRQNDQQQGDDTARKAHEFYLKHKAEIELGVKLGNENRYIKEQLPDNSLLEVSAFQHALNWIADHGRAAFDCELQNDPPERDDGIDRLILTAYHIQHGCLSSLERRDVPEGTVLITCGADVQKRGLHWTVIAWSDQAAGCVIDYDFWPFSGTEGQAASDCEVGILEGLHAWQQTHEEHPYLLPDGEVAPIDLTLIDMGWKDESWAIQPVQVFCEQAGLSRYMPSKGMPNYRQPRPDRKIVVGDNWHATFPSPFVAMNSDYWKLKVHEGFLLPPGSPGALSMFLHPEVHGRRNRNAHLSFAKHITAESWETKVVPGFKRPETKWWHYGKPNHWFDATYQAVVARSVRGLRTLAAATGDAKPQPTTASSVSTQSQHPEQQARKRINFRRRRS